MRLPFLQVVLLVTILSCEEDSTGQELLDQMNAVHAEIEALIELDCTEGTTCATLPMRIKPCGGPWLYIVFSTATDEVELQKLIDEFNSLNQKYNGVTGVVSDCSIVNPPEVACVEGVCRVID